MASTKTAGEDASAGAPPAPLKRDHEELKEAFSASKYTGRELEEAHIGIRCLHGQKDQLLRDAIDAGYGTDMSAYIRMLLFGDPRNVSAIVEEAQAS